MTGLEEINADRERFLEHAEAYWDALRKGTQAAKLANAETAAANAIASQWGKQGRVTELLAPLLSHPSEAARYGAAATLLNFGAPETAVAVLRDLATIARGLIAPTAKLPLMTKGIPLMPPS
jgi:hypothetical protein